MVGEATDKGTMIRRLAQYNDRWSSHVFNPAIHSVSDKLTPDQLREFGIFKDYSDRFLEKISPDIALVSWKAEALLFEEGNYIDLAFFLVEGTVGVSLKRHSKKKAEAEDAQVEKPTQGSVPLPEGTMIFDLVSLSKQTALRKDKKEITLLANMDFNLSADETMVMEPGELFGEIGALSGWPQSVTARTITECKLFHIRLPALRLMKNQSSHLKNRLDRLYRERSLFAQLKATQICAGLSDAFLRELTEKVTLVSLEPGQVLTNEGQPAEALFVVRSGFIKLMQRFGEGDLVVNYLSKGMTLGELELLLDDLRGWETSAISVEYAELIKIPRSVFEEILSQDADIEEMLWRTASQKVSEAGYSRQNLNHAEFTQASLDHGLVQGNSILVIDLDTCTRCDDCVRACAATHQGRPRFIREGHKINNLLIPKSCYHCKDPVCLVGCPTGAIHRVGTGEMIKIDGDICIGCSTCANNCPYDAIVMHDMEETWPDDMIPSLLRGTPRLQASKCDLCQDTGHEPACVSNCPQGCAVRVKSLSELKDWFEGV